MENLKICFAIPARLNSRRVPNKMLLKFDGKPLVRNVFDEVNSWGFDTFVVTDSKDIAEVIPDNSVIMTGEALNGSHRLSMVDWNYDYIINVQGDMLGIEFDTVKPLIKGMLDSGYEVGTLYTSGAEDNDVKVIRTGEKAHWFTRSNIGYGDRHLGVYAYRKEILSTYPELKEAYPVEDLEQNRLTVLNFNAYESTFNGVEINTIEDLSK